MVLFTFESEYSQEEMSAARLRVLGRRGRANLTDHDPTSPNDGIGNDTSTDAFETGWRKQVTMHLTGDDAGVRVVFSLAPI